MLIGEIYPNQAFISLEAMPELPEGHCHTNGNFSYVFDISTETGKATLSMAIAAYMAQSQVSVSGLNTCNIYGGVESLRSLLLK